MQSEQVSAAAVVSRREDRRTFMVEVVEVQEVLKVQEVREVLEVEEVQVRQYLRDKPSTTGSSTVCYQLILTRKHTR